MSQQFDGSLRIPAGRRSIGLVVAWLHASIVVPIVTFWDTFVLASSEELLTSWVRQAFQEAVRFINGLSSWFLSCVFQHTNYRDTLRKSWQHNPWQRWWSQVETRPSTLNALLASLYPAPASQEPLPDDTRNAYPPNGLHPGQTTGPTAAPSYPAGPDIPQHGTSSTHAHTAVPTIRQRRFTPPSMEAGQSAGPASVSSKETAAWALGGPGRPTAVVPSPAPAPAAVSQTGRKGAPAAQTPAMPRPVMFLQHSGMGILEGAAAQASRTTGVLEDLRLATELRLAAAFATARAWLRTTFALPPAPSMIPAAASSQVAAKPQPGRQGGDQGVAAGRDHAGAEAPERSSSSASSSSAYSSASSGKPSQPARAAQSQPSRSSRSGVEPVLPARPGSGRHAAHGAAAWTGLGRWPIARMQAEESQGADTEQGMSTEGAAGSGAAGAQQSGWLPRLFQSMMDSAGAEEEEEGGSRAGQGEAAVVVRGGEDEGAWQADSRPPQLLPRSQSAHLSVVRLPLNPSYANLGSATKLAPLQQEEEEPEGCCPQGAALPASSAAPPASRKPASSRPGHTPSGPSKAGSAAQEQGRDKAQAQAQGQGGRTPQAKDGMQRLGRRAWGAGGQWGGGGSGPLPPARQLRRTASFGAREAICGHQGELGSAGEVIRLAGYPLEVHTVVTQDGYVLMMERIPRPRSKDVVFYMHGVLDTSLTWVSAGVTGSQAFATWDAGYDVWLGSTRCNAPRLHTDPACPATSPLYWKYSVNELAQCDLAAQLDRIHNTKCTELGKGQVKLDLTHLGPLPAARPQPSTPNNGSRPSPLSPFTFQPAPGPRSATDMANTPTAPPPHPASAAAAAPTPAAAPTTPTATQPGPPAAPQPQPLPLPLPLQPALGASPAPAPHPQANTVPKASGPHLAKMDQMHAQPPAAAAAAAASPLQPELGQADPSSTPGSCSPSCQSTPSCCSGSSTAATAAAAAAAPLSPSTPPTPAYPAPNAAAGSGAPTTPPLPIAADTSPGSATHPASPCCCPAPAPPPTPFACSSPPMQDPGEPAPPHTLPDPPLPLPDPPASSPYQPLAAWQACTAAAAAAVGPVAAALRGFRRHNSHSHLPALASTTSDPPAACRPTATTDTSTAAAGLSFSSPWARLSSALGGALGGGPAAAEEAGPLSQGLGAALLLAGAGPGAAKQGLGLGLGLGRLSMPGQSEQAEASSDLAPPPPPLASSSRPSLLAWHSVGTAQLANPAAAAPPPPPAAPGAPSGPPTAWFSSSARPHPPAPHHSASAAGRVLAGGDGQQSPPASKGVTSGGTGAASLQLPQGAQEPYKLRAVAHSLGGMSSLIYMVTRAKEGRPHHIHRLILLTPAGFHAHMPNVAKPVSYILPVGLWVFRALTYPWWRHTPSWRPALPLYIPTTTFRTLVFKLLADLKELPSAAELVRLAIKLLLSDDASQWDRAMRMPHYGAKAMPAVSLDQLLHLTQCARSGRFTMFDYGTAAANRAAYGTAQPPDVAQQYWRLGDVPIDLVAGLFDGVIPPDNVRTHYKAMKAAGLQVSLKEFEFGHLDFTFAVKEDLKRYLMRLLRK